MGSIVALRGDITVIEVDAVVNAANSSLLGGGGVDGAIHLSAGPQLLGECQRLRDTVLLAGLGTAEAVFTAGYELPARWVVHTVGPKVWEHPDGGAQLLHLAHVNSVRCAYEAGARTVAFPAISCGVYGWEARDAAPIAVGAVMEAVRTYPLESVSFVLFSDEAHGHFADAIRRALEA